LRRWVDPAAGLPVRLRAQLEALGYDVIITLREDAA
jgi:hypothetical protein